MGALFSSRLKSSNFVSLRLNLEVVKVAQSNLSLCFVRFLLYVVYVFALCSPYLEDNKVSTILPAKSDSYVMFCLHSYRDLNSIDHECINPIRRIGLIHKRYIDSR